MKTYVQSWDIWKLKLKHHVALVWEWLTLSRGDSNLKPGQNKLDHRYTWWKHGTSNLQLNVWKTNARKHVNSYDFPGPIWSMSLIDSYLSFVITTNTSPFRMDRPPNPHHQSEQKSDFESYSSKVLLTSWNFFGSKGITLFQANRLVFFQLTRPIGIHLRILRCFFSGWDPAPLQRWLLYLSSSPPKKKQTKTQKVTSYQKRRASSFSFDLYNKKAATKQHITKKTIPWSCLLLQIIMTKETTTFWV